MGALRAAEPRLPPQRLLLLQDCPAKGARRRSGTEIKNGEACAVTILQARRPMFSAGASAAKSHSTQHKGRLRRAYKSAFCCDDKKLSAISERGSSQLIRLFYSNMF